MRARPPVGLDSVNTEFHRRLAHYNNRRVAPGVPSDAWRRDLEQALVYQTDEGMFIENSRKAVSEQAAAAPRDAGSFLRWFEDLKHAGPGQGDPLFPWLAQHASDNQMRWFLRQEAAGEAGFDDLVAYAQIQLPARPKLEMARNYWDEMGRGKERGMHGPMLSRLVAHLRLIPRIDTTVWEALALANTMLGLAINRRYALHAIGALGVVELTAPSRVSQVAAGLERLGYGPEQRLYFDLHAAIDIRHSRDWNAEVLTPLVEANPDYAPYLAEGALMRLQCGARCFDRYRAELWEREAADEPSGANRPQDCN